MVPMVPKLYISGGFHLSTCYSFSSNNNLPLEKVILYQTIITKDALSIRIHKATCNPHISLFYGET